jgi:hypothetical protein
VNSRLDPSGRTVLALMSFDSTLKILLVGISKSAYFFPSSLRILIRTCSVITPFLSSARISRKRMSADAPGAAGSSFRSRSSAGIGSHADCWAKALVHQHSNTMRTSRCAEGCKAFQFQAIRRWSNGVISNLPSRVRHCVYPFASPSQSQSGFGYSPPITPQTSTRPNPASPRLWLCIL